MLKTGITKIEQLLNRNEKDTRLISVSLLSELARTNLDKKTADDLRNIVVRSVILPNTTGKTTWENRFPEIDDAVAHILKRCFPQAIDCLDLGVSDGTTSVDLFSKLKTVPGLRYTASDINECLYVSNRKYWADVCDDNGRLLQISIGPFVVPITSTRHIHPLQFINRIIYIWNYLLRRQSVQKAWRLCEDGQGTRVSFEKIGLQSTTFMDLTNTDARICFKRINIFSMQEGPYDFIRIMNLLNVRQGGFGFSDLEIVKACENSLGLLRGGGFFLVGRTVPNSYGFETNATLYRNNDNQLVAHRVFGEGSEVDGLVSKAWANSRARRIDRMSAGD